jgi:fibro-slime domain-containing protein
MRIREGGKESFNMNVKSLCASGGALTLLVACGALLAPASTSVASPEAAESEKPPVVLLSGIVRDFREKTAENGHSDFENKPDRGFGHYCGNIDATLGSDGRPMFTGAGWKVTKQWKDNQGRPICHLLYSSAAGDVAGTKGASSKGGITSAESFGKWFEDHPPKNMSAPLTLAFVLQPDCSYVFDDKEDPLYDSLGGFFPVEDMLFGNPGGSPDRNFHFTFELHTRFTYRADDQQMFKFIGDDDVWVYINGKLVIDLGGVHAATEQYVDLNRLGLTDGQEYELDFFFAERHRTQSNFRIQTNLDLTSSPLPTITAAFD